MSLRFFSAAVSRASFLSALLGLAFVAPENAARADIQQAHQRNSPPGRALRELPANGVDQSVQVSAGGRVEITLQAHGQDGKTIEFLPRDQPAHGSLVDLHLVSRNSAVVTYVQDPGDSADTDQFTYAVQAPGSVVSAPVTVALQIVPLPSHVVATPGELDFGVVNVGKNSRAQVTLENRGGTVATGQLMPPSPWSVEGSPEYRLAKGEKQTFQLVFNPNGGQVFEDEIVFGSQPDQRARLFGTGVGAPAPLRMRPPEQPTLAVGSNPTPGSAADRAAAARAGTNGAGAASTASAPGAAVAANQPKPLDLGASDPGGRPIGSTYTVAKDPATLNEAAVNKIETRWSDSHTIEIAWKTPEPTPKSYRVELRYLSVEPDSRRLLINWRAYARTEFEKNGPETTATLRGLPDGTRQTIRVVALDSRDRAAEPSAYVQVDLPAAINWLRITPMRLLIAALLVCLVFVWRQRSQARQMMAELAESRAAAESYS